MEYFFWHVNNFINIISTILMLLSFLIELNNIKFFNVRIGSILHIYISIFASIMHIYEWKINQRISFEYMAYSCGVIILIAIIFAIINEIFSVFYGHEFKDESFEEFLYMGNINDFLKKIRLPSDNNLLEIKEKLKKL